jgi:hypothetical protein
MNADRITLESFMIVALFEAPLPYELGGECDVSTSAKQSGLQACELAMTAIGKGADRLSDRVVKRSVVLVSAETTGLA